MHSLLISNVLYFALLNFYAYHVLDDSDAGLTILSGSLWQSKRE